MIENSRLLPAKINLALHPIRSEDVSLQSFYLHLLHAAIQGLGERGRVARDILAAYQEAWNIPLENRKPTLNLDQIVGMLQKREHWREFWKFHERGYKYLLLFEMMFIYLDEFEFIHNCDFIQEFQRRLAIGPVSLHQLRHTLRLLLQGRIGEAEKHAPNVGDFRFFFDTFRNEEQFACLPEKKIAVVATMSSGKSTVLNALLGRKVFPSANQACTSKIVRWTHRPGLSRLTAYARNTGVDIRWQLTLDEMRQWNSDPSIPSVYIEGGDGPLSSFRSRKVVFIDTPGTNNSRDDRHGRITQDFLHGEDYDAVMYILDATNLATEDDQTLLHQTLEAAKGKQMVFLLNKVDALDMEAGETITGMLEMAVSYLRENGVPNPFVIPVSAYAALLFKLALGGQEFSRKETRDLDRLYALYQDESYDMNRYVRMGHPQETWDGDSVAEDNGVPYPLERLQLALYRTGLSLLPKIF
ncbi:dynamin family protein [Brevibacillus agri]|uniref:dynamin family protein n=1 Tax=Brevibacillus agri TaxID=51101 RepID=UPI003D256BD4